MAKSIAQLSVEMDVNTRRFNQKLKDVVKQNEKKMAAMQKDIKRLEKKGSASFNKLGAAAGAAAVAGVALLGREMLNVSREFARTNQESKAVADSIGLTVAELNAAGYAAESVGISTEQYADILKDVSDKLGDFTATGAGPFKDVMEILGDTIGYTAEELQKMSSNDVLKAVTAAMQRANLPLQQQVFLMESLGNDASRLLPIMRDNAAAANELEAEYRNLNGTISDTTNESFKDMETSFDRLGNNFSYMLTEVLQPVSEFLEDISDQLAELFKQMGDSSKIDNFLSVEASDIKTMETWKQVWGATTSEVSRLTAEINKFKKVQGDLEAELASGLTSDQRVLSISAQIAEGERLIAEKERQIKRLRELSEQGMNLSRSESGLAEGEDLEQTVVKNTFEKTSTDAPLTDEQQKELERQKMARDRQMEMLEMVHRSNLYQIAVDAGVAESQLLDQQRDFELQALEDRFGEMLGKTEEYEAAKAAIEDKYRAKKEEADAVSMMHSVDTIAAALGENLGAYEKYTSAMALIQSAQAMMQVWADPTLSFYEKIPAALLVGANVAQLMGQFHSGTDNVASEGSYLLQKGERVVQPKANKKLTDFLDGKGEAGGNITIESKIEMGPSLVDEKVFAEALSKQQKNLAALVRKEEHKRPGRRATRNR